MGSLEPLRVDFVLVAIERDDDGEIVGERQVGHGRAFPRHFDSLPDELRGVFAEAQEAAS
jgi:hypothetical protein